MSENNSNTILLPWPIYNKYFTVVSQDEKNYYAKCKLCVSSNQKLSTSVKSASNYKKHINKKHAFKVAELLAELKEEKLNKKRKNDNTDDDKPCKKQATLTLSVPMSRSTTQEQLDNMIIDFIVEGNHAFSTANQSKFRNLIEKGFPKLKIIDRKQVSKRTEQKSNAAKNALKEKLKLSTFVALTIDLWTNHNRSFICISGHWYDEELVRLSAVLALRRLNGVKHTFDILANIIFKVCREYDIHNKLVRATTDSASNFLKAFRVYAGATADEEVEQNLSEDEVDDDISEFDENEHIDDNEETDDVISHGSDEEEQPEPVEVTSILDNVDDQLAAIELGIKLPPHLRCGSHTFNLIATTDAKKASQEYENDTVMVKKAKDTYKKQRDSVMSRCQKLWNKQNRSSGVADDIKRIFGRLFPTPCVTRWNSEEESLRYMHCILKDDKSKSSLNDLCTQWKLLPFRKSDCIFIEEYLQVMEPIAKSLDTLQRDRAMCMGYLLPTVMYVIRSLKKLQEKPLLYCKPLVSACLSGTQNRFKNQLQDESLILAAISHPKFKLSWLKAVDNDCINKVEGEKILVKEFKAMYPREQRQENTENVILNDSSSTDEEDEFLIQDGDIVGNEFLIEDDAQLKIYLSSQDKTLGILKNLPIMQQMFIKHNTGLPSSAFVERIFSIAGDICTRKRGKMSDRTFESTLIYKYSLKST